MEIAERLKELRDLTGLSQEEFAASIGLKRPNYAAMELGRQFPTIETLKEIVKIYHNQFSLFTYEYILEGKRPAKAPKEVKGSNAKAAPASNLPRVITIDGSGDENIIYVPIKARAGYLTGYADPEFIQTLPVYKMPGLRHGTYRMFEADGPSMTPTVAHGDRVIAQWVEALDQIRDNRVHVITTKDGIIIKRVLNRINERGVLYLKSDTLHHRHEYPTIELLPQDIIEVWYAQMMFTTDFSEPGDIFRRISDIEIELIEVKKQLKKGS